MRVIEDLPHEAVVGLGRPHLVEEPGLVRLGDGEVLTLDDELDRTRLPDEAGQPLRAARPRKHPQAHLGQPHLERAGPGDPQIARQRDLEPSPDAVAVDGGDHELGRVFEAKERLVGVKAEVILEGLVSLLEHVDVRARAEVLVPVAGEHDDVDVVVEAGLQDVRVELLEHLVRVGVHGGVGQREERDSLLRGVAHQRPHRRLCSRSWNA